MKMLLLLLLWSYLASYAFGQGENELGFDLGFSLTEKECKLLIDPPMTTMKEGSKHYKALALLGPELLVKVLDRLETGRYSVKTGMQLTALLVPLSEGEHANPEIRARMSKVVQKLILSTDDKEMKVFLSAFFRSRGREEDIPFIREVLLKPTDKDRSLFLMRANALEALSRLRALQAGDNLRPSGYNPPENLQNRENGSDFFSQSGGPPLRSPETPIPHRDSVAMNSSPSLADNYICFAVIAAILAASVVMLVTMRGRKRARAQGTRGKCAKIDRSPADSEDL